MSIEVGEMCDICFISKENSPKTKFVKYDSSYNSGVEKYACDKCVEMAREVVARCRRQCANPKSDQIKGFNLWWKPKNGESAIDHKE